MFIKIENPRKGFLQLGCIYTAKFDGPEGTMKEAEVKLFEGGFSHPNDGVSRFLKPKDPLFWMDSSELINVEIEMVAK